MIIVNVHDAKTNFSKLVDQAHNGNEVIVAKAGKPWARLVPLEQKSERIPGRHVGRHAPASRVVLPGRP